MKKHTFNLCLGLLILSFFCVSNVFSQKTNTKKRIKSNQSATTLPESMIIPAKANFLTGINLDILNEINTLRSDPQTYVKILEEMKSGMKGNIVNLPDGTKWQMNEGLPALDDAINSLKKAAKVTPFSFSNGLAKAADIQLSNLKENMSLGHFGKDGSDIEVRLRSVGLPGDIYAENIAYYVKDARSVVLLMIIDDGLKSRSHRKNLLSTQFRELGLAFGNGKNNVGMCVVVFADRFTESAK